MLFMFVRNPELPYLTKIEGGLPVGRKIVIEGQVDSEAESFAINLRLGAQRNGETALHFNPRFSRLTSAPVVVRNSYTSFFGWGTEERRQAAQFPFKEGRHYKLEITCEQNSFMMNVDGKFFDFYNHRLDLSSITHLEIVGGTRVSVVQIVDDNQQEGNKVLNWSGSSSSSSLDKEGTEADNFCKMLAEKLKRLPVQKAIYAQTLIMNKVFEVEVEAAAAAQSAPKAPLMDKTGWNIL